MQVTYDGVMMDWGFGLQADETGKNGGMIYHSGEGATLSYYPDDHHIHLESADETYCGDYRLQE